MSRDDWLLWAAAANKSSIFLAGNKSSRFKAAATK